MICKYLCFVMYWEVVEVVVHWVVVELVDSGRQSRRREPHSHVCDVPCLPKTERTHVEDVVSQGLARV